MAMRPINSPNDEWTIKKFQIAVIKSKKLKSFDSLQLEKFLEENKWQEADRETNNLILEIVNRKEQGHLDDNAITQLSCECLQIIDRLWTQYSTGRFGFSIQNKIYREVGGKDNFDRITYTKLAELVGWYKNGKWLDRIYSLDAPSGHLPFLHILRTSENTASFFSRIAACNLSNNIFKKFTFKLTKKLFFAYRDENYPVLQVVENLIIDNDWIELTSEKTDADYIVTIDENEQYLICDQAEIPYSNIKPSLSIHDTNSPERLIKRLVHLSKYHTALNLKNNNSKLNNAVEYELLDENQQLFFNSNNINLKSGDSVYVRLKNISSQPLNIAILDFEPTWEISQIPIQGDRGAFYSLQPGEETLTRLRFELPDGKNYRSAQETLKLFFTCGNTNFRSLTLPPLDRELQLRVDADEENPSTTRIPPQISSLKQFIKRLLGQQRSSNAIDPDKDSNEDWSTKSINITVNQPIKILILASNSREELKLDRYIRDLGNLISRSNNINQFEVFIELGVKPRDLQYLLLKHKPQIVHFCGHGSEDRGLMLEDDLGNQRLVSTEALSNFFELLADRVECVLLNFVYDEAQAKEIVQHINYVIGMNQALSDDAAFDFSTGFYQALGYGQSIEDAFKFGCNAIQLITDVASESTQTSKTPEHLIPVLYKKDGIDEIKLTSDRTNI